MGLFGNGEPKPHRKKFFFGYYNFGGVARPMKWVEDDGLVVGGIPTPIVQRHEITDYDYDYVLLADLEQKYPVEEDVANRLKNYPQTGLT